MSRVLLITTRFYDYPSHIKKSIIKEGYSCDHFYDCPPLYRFFKQVKLSGLLNTFYWFVIRYFFMSNKYDRVILVRCEELPYEIIKSIRNYSENIVLYEWDSTENLKNYKNIIDSVDQVFSFDFSDCNTFGFTYKSLFYIDDFFVKENNCRDIDVLFVGTWHGDRNIVIKNFKKKCMKSKVKFYSYLYISPFLYAKLLIFGRERPKLNEVMFKKLSKEKLQKMYQRSKAVLDIHSATQTGLTMRTFEAIGSGCKVITTNSNISLEKNLNGMYITVARSLDDFDCSDFFLLISKKHLIPTKYSLKYWIVDLLK